MSHRKTLVDPTDFTIIIEGRKTNIPAYSKKTIAELQWDKYLNNRKGEFHKEPERNVEYF